MKILFLNFHWKLKFTYKICTTAYRKEWKVQTELELYKLTLKQEIKKKKLFSPWEFSLKTFSHLQPLLRLFSLIWITEYYSKDKQRIMMRSGKEELFKKFSPSQIIFFFVKLRRIMMHSIAIGLKFSSHYQFPQLLRK